MQISSHPRRIDSDPVLHYHGYLIWQRIFEANQMVDMPALTTQAGLFRWWDTGLSAFS
jgi:hypothetical protein